MFEFIEYSTGWFIPRRDKYLVALFDMRSLLVLGLSELIKIDPFPAGNFSHSGFNISYRSSSEAVVCGDRIAFLAQKLIRL